MVILRRLTVHGLDSAKNGEEDIFRLLADQEELSAGMRIDGPGAELIIGNCEPSLGSFSQGKTEVTLADHVLKVFQKVHVLPYHDTFKYNFDHMYLHHMVPYFQSCQSGEFTEGFDFTHENVRFSVVGVFPAKSYGVVGQATEIFYEGPAIERRVLQRLQVVPYEVGLPEHYRPTKLSLDEAALLSDFLRPYFEQRSAELRTGDVVPIHGVRFKVIACRPSEGGGVGRDTEIVCQGVALRENPVTQNAAAKTAAKGKARPSAKSVVAAAAARRAASQPGDPTPSD
eukprot:CAMPEP_0172765080 /NCGR_PEP_ID=MMETSP1074-20121228/178564_1 /TAXON_ID=2916 /ORGANISM="Ceratium fusus, Strain PA161109" /LENGTH=284 /DNA_ID=CAMNT_0013599963 /DNA_START=24 /DNA_END=875 /DNA_ORIENTATION=+